MARSPGVSRLSSASGDPTGGPGVDTGRGLLDILGTLVQVTGQYFRGVRVSGLALDNTSVR